MTPAEIAALVAALARAMTILESIGSIILDRVNDLTPEQRAQIVADRKAAEDRFDQLVRTIKENGG